jgi:PncC family amidohydrolase
MNVNELSIETGELLLSKNFTIAVAESCTGGLLGGALTDPAGSSRYFRGGIIAYDNAIKECILKVSHNTLVKYGAVSHETAREMVSGACQLLTTPCAISVTGIAGPGGETQNKPVGLVYIGIAINNHIESFECHFTGNRQTVRESTVIEALSLFIKQFCTVD